VAKLPEPHVIGFPGGLDLLLLDPPFGDVRDVITSAPHWGDHGYATSDIFTVRFPLIEELAPRAVFEFGSLLGYFLLTAAAAAPSIERLGWIDNETDVAGSNELCAENLADYTSKTGHALDVFYETQTRRCLEFGFADLVQVDGAHSYPDCLTDLIWALELKPSVIFVDDYSAISDVKRATDEFARWQRLDVEYHPTVNGLAVLRF
jgi:predicted O-methyltransferase YrrM